MTYLCLEKSSNIDTTASCKWHRKDWRIYIHLVSPLKNSSFSFSFNCISIISICIGEQSVQGARTRAASAYSEHIQHRPSTSLLSTVELVRVILFTWLLAALDTAGFVNNSAKRRDTKVGVWLIDFNWRDEEIQTFSGQIRALSIELHHLSPPVIYSTTTHHHLTSLHLKTGPKPFLEDSGSDSSFISSLLWALRRHTSTYSSDTPFEPSGQAGHPPTTSPRAVQLFKQCTYSPKVVFCASAVVKVVTAYNRAVTAFLSVFYDFSTTFHDFPHLSNFSLGSHFFLSAKPTHIPSPHSSKGGPSSPLPSRLTWELWVWPFTPVDTFLARFDVWTLCFKNTRPHAHTRQQSSSLEPNPVSTLTPNASTRVATIE